MSYVQIPATYGDPEIRGKMRQWKMELARQCTIFDRVYERRDSVLLPIIRGFVFRGKIGKERAFTKLRKLLGPGAYLEGVRYSPAPLAVFSLLRPRESITLNAPIDTGLMQDCVTVNYILAGELPPHDGDPPHMRMIGVAEGHWTLEVPDHAIGRCIHRTRLLPNRIIREAHHNLLRMNAGLVLGSNNRVNLDARFNVRAGPGGFVCTFRVGEEVSSKSYMARVRADTWIAEEDGDHQGLLTGNAHPGHRLADSWLLPMPLRRIRRDSKNSVQLETYPDIPMPELRYQL